MCQVSGLVHVLGRTTEQIKTRAASPVSRLGKACGKACGKAWEGFLVVRVEFCCFPFAHSGSISDTSMNTSTYGVPGMSLRRHKFTRAHRITRHDDNRKGTCSLVCFGTRQGTEWRFLFAACWEFRILCAQQPVIVYRMTHMTVHTPNSSKPGGLFLFCFFDRHPITGGNVEYHTPFEARPENGIELQSDYTRWAPLKHNMHRYGCRYQH